MFDDDLTAEQRVRAVELVHDIAALNLDEQPPEMACIVRDARRLVSDAARGVDFDDGTPPQPDDTGR